MADDTVRVNLHCHTNKSDGSAYPASYLVDFLQHGVEYANMSDHDTTSGWETILKSNFAQYLEQGPGYFAANANRLLEEMLGRGRDRRGQLPLIEQQLRSTRIYQGIELTVRYKEMHSIHILGAGIDAPPPPVRAHFAAQTQDRYKRLEAMVGRLVAERGISISWEGGPDSVRSIAGESEAPTRMHIGEALRRAGYGLTARDCMDAYTDATKDANLDLSLLYEAQESIAVIMKQLRGVPVLSHPFRSAKYMAMTPEDLIREFVDYGIRFLDANDEKEFERLTKLAEPYGDRLVILGGHDTHGEYDKPHKKNRPYVEIPRQNVMRLEQAIAESKGIPSLEAPRAYM